MKKLFLFASAGLLALSSAVASAADMSLPMKAQPPAPPAYYPWTGFYIGGNVGSGMANTDVNGTSTGTFGAKAFQESFSASRSQHGPLAGGQLGINYEFAPHWVLGAEADIDWSNIKGSVTPCSSKNAAGVIDCLNVTGKIEDFGTGRARLGYVFDNLLVYGTGGFAWANETATVSESCDGAKCPKTSNKFAFNSASSSATPFGWSRSRLVETSKNKLSSAGHPSPASQSNPRPHHGRGYISETLTASSRAFDRGEYRTPAG